MGKAVAVIEDQPPDDLFLEEDQPIQDIQNSFEVVRTRYEVPTAPESVKPLYRLNEDGSLPSKLIILSVNKTISFVL